MNVDEIAKSLWPALLKHLPLESLARALSPVVSQLQLNQPRIWGDPARFVNKNTVNCCNILVNTRCGSVTVEQNVLFGHNVSLLTGTHNYRQRGMARIRDVPADGRDIIIEEGAWLASGVTVIGPARIGAHACVSANSLVLGNIKSGWLYAGSPAVPIRKIDFSE